MEKRLEKLLRSCSLNFPHLPLLWTLSVDPMFFSSGIECQTLCIIFIKRALVPTSSVANQNPGSGAFLIPGSGMGKKSRSGFGMKIPDHISESLETIFWVKNT
jgi:hypothetical protein